MLMKSLKIMRPAAYHDPVEDVHGYTQIVTLAAREISPNRSFRGKANPRLIQGYLFVKSGARVARSL